MFTHLFETVFPQLGDVFGRLSALADISFSTFLDIFFIGRDAEIVYVNFFTGVYSGFKPPSFGDHLIISNLFLTVRNFLVAYFPDFASLPLWIVLLNCSCTLFFAIYILKFVIDVIR